LTVAASSADSLMAGAISGPGTLQFRLTNYSVSETVPSVMLEVSRNQGSAGTVSVDFTTADGTAEAGSDYQATNGTLTFGPGVVKSH
jgi:Calx-beta domain-containing protein